MDSLFSMQAETPSIETVQVTFVPKPYVIYFYGPEGSGKTTAAREWLEQRMQENGEHQTIDEVGVFTDGLHGCNGSHYVLIDNWMPQLIRGFRWAELFAYYSTDPHELPVDGEWAPRYVAITGIYDERNLINYHMLYHDAYDIVKSFRESWKLSRGELPDGDELFYREQGDVDEALEYLFESQEWEAWMLYEEYMEAHGYDN